jgi:hypothetical protein
MFALASQRPGARGSGPAVIEGPFFTMRIPEGWQFETTAAGDLRPAPASTAGSSTRGEEPSGRWGMVAGPEFWAGVTPSAQVRLVLAPVPAEAEPDAVMKQVRALA